MATLAAGKRNRVKREDFLAFAEHCGISLDHAARRIADLLALREAFHRMIGASALGSVGRTRLAEIMSSRLDRLA
jgi:hypothetical protein